MYMAIVATMLSIVSCEDPVTPQEPSDKPGTENPEQPGPEEPGPEQPGPEDPAPDQPPFTMKVYDVSAVTATVEVEPADKEAPYYMDIISESNFLQAQQYGFDDYMTWFLETMMNQYGESLEQVVKKISSYGNDGFIITTLKPQTVYYAIAVGIGEDGMTTTEVVYERFETSEMEVSENSFDLSVEDITATTGVVKVDAATDDPYILTIEPTSLIEGMTDAELADHVIQNNIAWGGLESITYSGDQEIEWLGKAGWNYVVVAFGYESGSVTTDVARYEFKMGEGGDPAACKFEFSQEFSDFDMYLGVKPSDESVVYICNYLERGDLMALISATGSVDAAFLECLTTLVEEMVMDLGSRENVIDLITDMGPQGFNTTKFKPDTEYIQWAVPVDQDGNPTASFSFSLPFLTPKEKISDAELSIKSYKYYDGTALAEIYPDLKHAKGYAVVDLQVEPSATAVNWWSYIALEDLTDRSRRVIINNVTNAPTEPNMTRQLILAYWGVNTIMGVAQDADGGYGPLMLEVVDFNKENASPVSEFEF